jgi:hypothetical protein
LIRSRWMAVVCFHIVVGVSDSGDGVARRLLDTMSVALGLPLGMSSRVRFTGDDRLGSCFAVSDLARGYVGSRQRLLRGGTGVARECLGRSPENV